MRLYVMRHGPAEDRGPSGGDSDRRLTDQGRQLVRSVAHALRRSRSVELPRLLTSPLTRAQQTAAIVRDVAGAPGLVLEPRDELTLETPSLELVEEVSSGGRDTLLVGHQPAVELLVHALLRMGTEGRRSLPPMRPFRTALIAILEPKEDSAGWIYRSTIDPDRL